MNDEVQVAGDRPLAGTSALLARWRRLVAHGPGLAKVPTLAALLSGATVLSPWQARRNGADAVLAWGRKPSALRARDWAAARGWPLLNLEDGLLRSLGLGPDAPPLSLMLDDEGVYYDATAPSRLERFAAQVLTSAQARRAWTLQRAWCDQRVSKYNQAREALYAAQEGDVLVVDQTAGDASISHGAASPVSFRRMLEAALDEHPQARILLKVHPDVVAGRKQGHFGGTLSAGAAARVRILAADAHPAGLLSSVEAVYVVTSQMGFEALMWNRPVRCFGLPFYAGWGLTRDELAAPPRRHPIGLETLIHAALVDCPRYLHPETRSLCEPEALLEWMGLQRRMRERFPPEVVAQGFSIWKRPIVRRYFAGSQVRFQAVHTPVPDGATLVTWGCPPAPGPGAPTQAGTRIRLEDGFLRSVGLGADLRQPLSWVQDPVGLYYDAAAPSALEDLLQTGNFPSELRVRAARLRERIVQEGLTKYNLSGPAWARPAGAAQVVLVVGQVEDDASLRHGAPGLHTNVGLLQAVRLARPDAWLVYKPHPDVVVRLREPGAGESKSAKFCDEIVTDAPIGPMLGQVDEVHVLTSLAGFEALLRGKPVVTWGCPFYAGWGLTQDQIPCGRRTRRLDLDMLVAGALVLYPTYVSAVTGQFTTPERVLDELIVQRDRTRPVEGAAALLMTVRRALLRWGRRFRRATD